MIQPLVIPAAPHDPWPFAVAAISFVFIIVAISRLKMHAFIALIFAAFLAGFMPTQLPAVAIDRLLAMLREDPKADSWATAVELMALKFDGAAGSRLSCRSRGAL